MIVRIYLRTGSVSHFDHRSDISIERFQQVVNDVNRGASLILNDLFVPSSNVAAVLLMREETVEFDQPPKEKLN